MYCGNNTQILEHFPCYHQNMERVISNQYSQIKITGKHKCLPTSHYHLTSPQCFTSTQHWHCRSTYLSVTFDSMGVTSVSCSLYNGRRMDFLCKTLIKFCSGREWKADNQQSSEISAQVFHKRQTENYSVRVKRKRMYLICVDTISTFHGRKERHLTLQWRAPDLIPECIILWQWIWGLRHNPNHNSTTVRKHETYFHTEGDEDVSHRQSRWGSKVYTAMKEKSKSRF
jgi:hypothetical protein